MGGGREESLFRMKRERKIIVRGYGHAHPDPHLPSHRGSVAVCNENGTAVLLCYYVLWDYEEAKRKRESVCKRWVMGKVKFFQFQSHTFGRKRKSGYVW